VGRPSSHLSEVFSMERWTRIVIRKHTKVIVASERRR
jgi:hypothetical protein